MYQQSIQLTESFNQHRLHYIVENYESLTNSFDKYKPSGDDEKKDSERQRKQKRDKFAARNLLLTSSNGRCARSYEKKECGRYYAKGVCLQNAPNFIRGAICEDIYRDLDFKACNFSILKCLLIRHKYEGDTENLDFYLDNREECLALTGLSRGDAKTAYTAVLNGGSMNKNIKSKNYKLLALDLEDMRDYLFDFYPKAVEYRDELEKRMRKVKKADRINPDAKAFSRIIFDMESELLMTLYDAIGSPDDCVLVHDGLMVSKDIEVNFDELSRFLTLEACWTELDEPVMQLIEKPVKSSIKFPDNLPMYEDIDIEKFGSYRHLISREYSTIPYKFFTKWLDNTVNFVSNGGNLTVYTVNMTYDYETQRKVKEVKPQALKDFYATLDVDIAFDHENKDFDYDFNIKNKTKISDNRTKESKDNRVFRSRNLAKYIHHMYSTGKIRIYDQVDYIPYIQKYKEKYNNPDVFNTFQGYLIDDDSIQTDVDFTESHWYKYMKKYMFTEPGEFDHFIAHLADMIQRPLGPRPSSHVFVSQDQGTGKGTLLDWVTNMLGHKYTYATEMAGKFLTSGFNSDSTGALVKVFEESPDGGSTVMLSEILKAIIKEKRERVEYKGKDAYHVRAISRYWIFSQHKNVVHLEPADRRYTLHYLSSEKANDPAIFDPIHAEISDVKFLRASFLYLANYEYDEADPVKICPTKFRKEQIINSMSSGLTMLKDFIEGRYEQSQVTADNESDIMWRIPSSVLNSSFSGSPKTLATQLDKLGLKKETKKMRNIYTSGATFCYNIYPPRIEALYQKYLKQEDFKFNLTVLEEPEPENELPEEAPEVEEEVEEEPEEEEEEEAELSEDDLEDYYEDYYEDL